MNNAMDQWVITDASPEWDFRIEIDKDENSGRPEAHGDVYNADAMNDAYNKDANATDEEREAAVLWARQAVRAWELREWTFVVVSVTPVHKKHGDIFQGASVSVGGCDYGRLPKGDGTIVDTSTREYVMSAWGDDLVSEATGQGYEALAKMRDNHKAKIDRTAQKIVDHVGGTLENARAAAVDIFGAGI